MTELLYLKDSYQKEFDANIENIEGNEVYLDKTLFYPTGGGQMHDTGWLTQDGKKYNVVEVKKTESGVAHVIEGDEMPDKDKPVHGQIDYERRYKMMRAHTASHALCAIINEKTGAKVSGHKISPDKTSIDFTLPDMDKEMMEQAVVECNEKMAKGVEVKLSWMDREEALEDPELVKLANVLPPQVKTLRIVTIEGIDRQADGGTHVKNTNEVGKINIIKTENKGKGRKRIYFELAPQG